MLAGFSMAIFYNSCFWIPTLFLALWFFVQGIISRYLERKNGGVVLDSFKHAFFKSPLQKSWIDFFACGIILATLSIYIGKSILDPEKLANMHHLSFNSWDTLAIVLSLPLTLFYLLDIKDIVVAILLQGENSNNNGNDTDRKTFFSIQLLKFLGFSAILSILVTLFLMGAIYFLLMDNHIGMLLCLLFTAIIFTAFDLWMLCKVVENKKVITIKQSLYYGNIPATLGFLILISVEMTFRFNGLNSTELHGFIAGGASMHIVFGNIVVAVGLE
jgi:hypothetical protein